MRDLYSEYDNVEDFIEHKMHALIREMDESQRFDVASILADALASYMVGDTDIVFIGGLPYTTPRKDQDT